MVVLAAGATLATTLSLDVGTPLADASVLLGSTAVFSIAVAVVSRWYLEHKGDATLRNQVLAVSTSSIATVVVGTLVAARLMFISVHDLNALLAVTTIAVAVSVASSFQLATRFHTDARSVGLIAEQLVTRPLAPPVRDGFGIKEMRDLARRLEELSAELEHSRDRERALDVSRREFVSWVSHDLRSPLATIRALAEALEDGIASDDDERAGYHRSILRESERLTVLVDDLFELSRLHAGTIPKAPLAVPVQEIVDDAVTAIVHSAESNGVRIDCDVAAIGTRLVPATDMTRALRNLLDNAVRHTRHGGVIRLEGHRDATAIVLTVHDECGGIPDSDLDRVFETAFRGDVSRGRHGGGGGLGLAIARGLVESHAGQIDVQNHGQGCLFRIRLPAPE